MNRKDNAAIDFVIVWVDDSDSKWQAERRKYVAEDINFMNVNDCRYRDQGLLRYWFRSVEQYAPWVRRIHFVTCGHYPEWLNLTHPHLNFVKHEDYISAEYLPTFSVNPIELNLHRIDGLAEQFVFFNDDMFVSGPVLPTDFFVDGLPRDVALRAIPLTGDIGSINLNDINIIQKEFYFPSQFKKNFWKWMNYRYGIQCLRNIHLLPYRYFTGVKNTHVANAYRKKTFEEVWLKYGDVLDKTCRHRFRSPLDVNQWLMKYWQIVSGQFFPQRYSFGKLYSANQTKEIEWELDRKRTKLLCINDNEGVSNFEQIKEETIRIFERLFPEKSSFEL